MKRARRSKKSAVSAPAGRREAAFRFQKEDRDKLLTLLRQRLGVSPKTKAVGTFQRAVELAVDGFDFYRQLEKRSGTYGAETTLKPFKDCTSQLKRAMDGMNADTRFHLELCLQAPTFHVDSAARRKRSNKEPVLAMIETARATRLAAQAFIDRLKQDLTILDIAAAVAATAPQHTRSGRPKEHWRLELATEIARAFAKCFKLEPTAQEAQAAEQTPFTAVLGICLDAAGVYVKDLTRLAQEAVARTKVQESPPLR